MEINNFQEKIENILNTLIELQEKEFDVIQLLNIFKYFIECYDDGKYKPIKCKSCRNKCYCEECEFFGYEIFDEIEYFLK